MARRIPTFVVLLPLLAACATTAPVSTYTSSDGEAVYLAPVTTRYSVALDELRARQGRTAESRLPNALVAGDANMTVAGSVFRDGSVFTLDMIVRNHGEQPLQFDRESIELYDDAGQQLTPMLDWSRGPDYGLRAKQVTYRGYYGVNEPQQDSNSPLINPKMTQDSKAQTKQVATAPSTGDRNTEEYIDTGWLQALELERQTVVLPADVHLAPETSTPYWAYWRGVDVQYPLTASIRIGEKKVLMQFDDPSAARQHEAR